MRNVGSLFGVCAVVALAGCMPGAKLPGPQQPAQQTTEPGKASPEATAQLMKITQQNLDQCKEKTDDADKKLDVALSKAAGGSPDAAGKPTPAMADLVAALKKEKITVAINNVGSPQMPILMVKDSLMDEGQKLQGAPPAKMQAYAKRMMAAQPYLTPMRDDVAALNTALGASWQSTMACTGFAKGLTQAFGGMKNGGQDPSPELFAVYAKLLQANAQSEANVASSMATVSAMQAGLSGTTKDPKALTKLIDALKQAKATPVVVTEDDAKQAYTAAASGLVNACQEQLDKYYADHPEAKKPDGPSPCSPEGAKAKGAPPPAGSPLDLATAKGDFIQHLVPSDGPMAQAAEGLAAMQKGDYLGALKSAAKLVPKGSPVGMALGAFTSLFG